MGKQRSQQERKISSVTGSTAGSEPGWSELTRRKSSPPAMERGIPEEASRELWEPQEIEEPIAPDTER
ncbi:MAG TPA: hypothetical protein VN033_13855 [Vulgatibacter sp.]|nr:hypothetical protein [Vulgatibacter sp.]